MNTDETHLLTGAYVLHALPPDEHDRFERHLPSCPSCAQEVRELAATAGRLGSAVSVTPPAAMKREVMSRIATERQEPPVVARRTQRAGGRRRLAASRFALAACVAAAAAFGGVAVWQHREAEDARTAARAAERAADELSAVLSAPDAKVSAGKLPDGAGATVVVSRERDRAVFVASAMPRPPAGKVYQLWFSDGDAMRPAGLLDASGGSGAVMMEGPVDGASGMGITLEPAGGSPRPTSAPLAVMDFPA
ncbi:anti-sigma factor domain-containing protein [Streptomyces sp. t39]|uniref:anti-sigma factor n=1 Tax=Streptomyces sp. t39 TaxID=1828156 RepID=UPI0011CD7945|nr:anti-sigma factor [Streptomyces sp. t39]TXS51317.1 anti-sigma factor [Streptomyces sp. t39]